MWTAQGLGGHTHIQKVHIKKYLKIGPINTKVTIIENKYLSVREYKEGPTPMADVLTVGAAKAFCWEALEQGSSVRQETYLHISVLAGDRVRVRHLAEHSAEH